jgi:cysteine-rich repeat protein
VIHKTSSIITQLVSLFFQQDVNGARLTSFAGGSDDGFPQNGGLLTVGGYDDSNDNPVNPFGQDPDDELYNLVPFLVEGDDDIEVQTVNPSNDDIIFFAAIFSTIPSTSLMFCGDGNLDDGEECDDGNKDADDGCSPICLNEPKKSGANGDPHFKTWSGKHFDFHGVCDLVLLHSKEFESGLDLDVHIRTHMRRDMSYISSAALRIGTDLLEVESRGVYYLNRVASADLPSDFGGFEFLHTQPTDKQHVFEVHLGGRERIIIKTYKDFVSVSFEQGESKHFAKSVGLMGDFAMGQMIARDGKTVMTDANVFGQEWQVLDTEPSLFQTVRFPQHPKNACTIPTPVQASQLRRRLSEKSKDAELAAEKACQHWGEGKEDCVFDVLTTDDLEMAVGGTY